MSAPTIMSLRTLLRRVPSICQHMRAASGMKYTAAANENVKRLAKTGESHRTLHARATENDSPSISYESLMQASIGSKVKNNRIVQSLRCCDGMLELTFKDHSVSRYHPKWLYYNCSCSVCIQLHSGQRLIQPRGIPDHLTITGVSEHVSADGAFVEVQFREIDHCARLPQEWLRLYSYSWDSLQEKSDLRDPPYSEGPLKSFSYNELQDKDGETYFEWIHNLNLDGVVLVTDVPLNNEAVGEVAKLIGPIQENLYGRLSDVKTSESPINIAYTTVGLDQHQDLVYYESPPGLQLLHCLSFCPEVTGGESIFVDIFRTAEIFRDEHPHHFQTLLKVPATFKKIHFERDNPAAFLYQRPHITINSQEKITNVVWAPPFEGPLQVEEKFVEPYFAAYKAFAEMIDKTHVVKHRMVPGDCLVFNNRRMLHGRESFRLNGGKRHFRLCYVNIDDYLQTVHLQHLKRKTGQFPRRVGNQCEF